MHENDTIYSFNDYFKLYSSSDFVERAGHGYNIALLGKL